MQLVKAARPCPERDAAAKADCFAQTSHVTPADVARGRSRCSRVNARLWEQQPITSVVFCRKRLLALSSSLRLGFEKDPSTLIESDKGANFSRAPLPYSCDNELQELSLVFARFGSLCFANEIDGSSSFEPKGRGSEAGPSDLKRKPSFRRAWSSPSSKRRRRDWRLESENSKGKKDRRRLKGVSSSNTQCLGSTTSLLILCGACCGRGRRQLRRGGDPNKQPTERKGGLQRLERRHLRLDTQRGDREEGCF